MLAAALPALPGAPAAVRTATVLHHVILLLYRAGGGRQIGLWELLGIRLLICCNLDRVTPRVVRNKHDLATKPERSDSLTERFLVNVLSMSTASHHNRRFASTAQ